MQPLPAIPTVPAPPPATDAINAFMTHNWYAFAAIVLMLFIQVLRSYEVKLWTKTPNGVRFLWPIVLGAIAAFVHGFIAHEPLNQSLMDTLNSIWQIALPAMGGAALLKESPLPWDGGAGGIPASPVPASPPLPPLLTLVPSNDHSPLSPEDDRPTPVDPRSAPLPPSEPPAA